jgi:predicted RNA-binding protein with PUA-like domain
VIFFSQIIPEQPCIWDGAHEPVAMTETVRHAAAAEHVHQYKSVSIIDSPTNLENPPTRADFSHLLYTLSMNADTRYWLMKSEPESYSITHLKKDKKTAWTGVRNFLARNYMRQMQPGDGILFYHSSCAIPGVYGLAEVASKPYPDPSQFDDKGHYYEPRATKTKPVWDLVDIKYIATLKQPVPLSEIREHTQLHGMEILKPRSRLSVTSVTKSEYEEIVRLGN